MGYCRGFGIQSPWAYRFVRYVVNEHYPYYAYDNMKAKYPYLSPLEHHIGRLFFRISNYVRGAHWAFAFENIPYLSAYIMAGSHSATISSAVHVPLDKGIDILVMALSDGIEPLFRSFCSHAGKKSMLIVMDIRKSKTSLSKWKRMTHDHHTGVCFDLYYCGLIFFNTSMTKEVYKVNF